MAVKRFIIALGSLCLGQRIWQLAVTLTEVPKFNLPGPMLVLTTIWKSRALLAEHALITISEVVIGLVLGTVLGGFSAIPGLRC